MCNGKLAISKCTLNSVFDVVAELMIENQCGATNSLHADYLYVGQI